MACRSAILTVKIIFLCYIINFLLSNIQNIPLTSQNCNIQGQASNKFTSRYVKITSTSTLSFSQLACYDENGFNVAYGKIVTASSVLNSSINPNIITDGYTYSRPFPDIYSSAENVLSSVTIDFGRDFVIYKCVIYNRSDCCQSNILNSKIMLKNSNNDTIAYNKITSSDNFVEIIFKSYPFQRYVVVNKSKIQADYYLQIAQIACYDKYNNNIAYLKPVSATSIWHSEIVISRVTDGTLEARPYPQIYHSAGWDTNAKLTIDLGSNFEIIKCRYYNRIGCCQERTNGVKMEILDSNNVVVNSYVITTTVTDYIDIFFDTYS